jgi:hypothetical protein
VRAVEEGKLDLRGRRVGRVGGTGDAHVRPHGVGLADSGKRDQRRDTRNSCLKDESMVSRTDRPTTRALTNCEVHRSVMSRRSSFAR